MSSTITAVPTRILALTAGASVPAPPSGPVQGPLPPPETSAPTADTPEPETAVSEPPVRRGPSAPLGALLSLAADGCAATAATGQPLSVETDGVLRQLRIHTANADQFRAWAVWLRVPLTKARVSRDLLGPVVTLTAPRSPQGWALTLHLSGPPVLELS